MSQADSNPYSGCGFLLVGMVAIAGAAWWSGLFPFQRNTNPRHPAHAEVKTYVGTLNRAQQAYYLEQTRLTDNIAALNIGINPETKFFSYRATLLSDWAVQHSGIPKEAGFYSYIGLVWLVPIEGTTDEAASDTIATTPNAMMCISETRTTTEPPEFQLPEWPITADTTIPCPEGYTLYN